MRQCLADLGLSRGWVISTASERRSLSSSVEVIPWNEIVSGKAELF
jgi:hypothetical protein